MPYPLQSILGEYQPILLIFLVIAVMYLVLRITGRRFRELQQQTATWKADLREKAARASTGTASAASAATGRGGADSRGAAAELNKVFVELHDFAREVEGRLDTKMTYLRKLLEDVEAAERRIEARLARLEAGAASREQAVSRSDAVAVATTGPAADAQPSPGDEADTGGSDPTASDPKAAHASPDGGPGRDDDPATFGRVVELFQSGASPSGIADATGLPKGEVELMLNLHQSKLGAGGAAAVPD